jgi:uncharacterized membrane protein YgdD (TMEM256/DUF423 family)
LAPGSKALLLIASLSLGAATALGAYASHGLAAAVDADTLRAVLTAIDYQFYHSLGLIAVVLVGERAARATAWRLAGYCFVAGIVLFSGSIYATAAGAPDWLGGAAPLGGLTFIAGWLVCAVGAVGIDSGTRS